VCFTAASAIAKLGFVAESFIPKNYRVAREGVEIGEFTPFDFFEGVDSGKDARGHFDTCWRIKKENQVGRRIYRAVISYEIAFAIF
jgi:hypothetical protein